MRLLTAVAVIGLCAFAAFRGWGIVGFAVARAHGASGDQQAVRAWIGVAGLAGAAREASLTQVADPADIEGARQRGEDLAAILSVRPLSSTNWLSLAGMRLVTAQPYQQVLAALTMSWVTGANEGAVMLQRGIFGLLQWEALPPDARKRIIADLAGVVLGTSIHDVSITPAKNVLSNKSADTRREIAGLLRAEGVSATELARMGL
jgi:hypothetical protein